MSDDERDEETWSNGSGGSGGDDNGVLPPPCAICCGVILFIIGVFCVWQTEATYVKNLEALNGALTDSVVPCSFDKTGACTKCDMSKVESGSLVFLSCTLRNLQDLTNASSGIAAKDPQLKQLQPLIVGTEPSMKYSWSSEMYQQAYQKTTVSIKMDSANPPKSGRIGCPLAHGSYNNGVQQSKCCGSSDVKKFGKGSLLLAGQREFLGGYVGDSRTCQAIVGSTGGGNSGGGSTGGGSTGGGSTGGGSVKQCSALGNNNAECLKGKNCYFEQRGTKQCKDAPCKPKKGSLQKEDCVKYEMCYWNFTGDWTTSCQVSPCYAANKATCESESKRCIWNFQQQGWEYSCKNKGNHVPVPTTTTTTTTTVKKSGPVTPAPVCSGAQQAPCKANPNCLWDVRVYDDSKKNWAECCKDSPCTPKSGPLKRDLCTADACWWNYTGDWKTACQNTKCYGLSKSDCTANDGKTYDPDICIWDQGVTNTKKGSNGCKPKPKASPATTTTTTTTTTAKKATTTTTTTTTKGGSPTGCAQQNQVSCRGMPTCYWDGKVYSSTNDWKQGCKDSPCKATPTPLNKAACEQKDMCVWNMTAGGGDWQKACQVTQCYGRTQSDCGAQPVNMKCVFGGADKNDCKVQRESTPVGPTPWGPTSDTCKEKNKADCAGLQSGGKCFYDSREQSKESDSWKKTCKDNRCQGTSQAKCAVTPECRWDGSCKVDADCLAKKETECTAPKCEWSASAKAANNNNWKYGCLVKRGSRRLSSVRDDADEDDGLLSSLHIFDDADAVHGGLSMLGMADEDEVDEHSTEDEEYDSEVLDEALDDGEAHAEEVLGAVGFTELGAMLVPDMRTGNHSDDVSLRGRGRGRSPTPAPPPTTFTCSYDCHQFKEAWSSSHYPDPFTWAVKPKSKFKTLVYVEGNLAKDMPSLFSGNYDNLGATATSVKVGPDFLLGSPASLNIDDPMSTATLAASNGASSASAFRREKASNKSSNGLTYITMRGDKTVWDVQHSTVPAADNCIYTYSSEGTPAVGQMRVCFKRSGLQSLSIIAEATKTGNEWKLKPSDTYLQQWHGTKLKTNEIVPLKKLIQGAIEHEDNMLFIRRIIFPCIVWLAIYCCLTPIVWVIDNMGEALENIPCVGGCFGEIAECLETMATCLICIASCLCGIMVSFVVGGVAWLVYRPVIGIGFLAVAACMCGCIVFLKMNQKGEKKVRRRKSRSAGPQAMEMGGVSNPNVAPGMMAQPMMAQPMTMAAQQQMMQVQCPMGVGPGSQIQVTTPDGRAVMVQVPMNVMQGQMFQVMV